MTEHALRTYTSTLRTLRNEADGDTAIVTDTASNFQQIPTGAINIDTAGSESKANAIAIQMCAGHTISDTFSWSLYGWRENNGVASQLCSGTAILGTMQVVAYPNTVGTTTATAKFAAATSKFWAGTIAITENTAIKTFGVADSGNNRAATLWGDLSGYTNLYLEITEADGSTGVQAGDVSAFYAGW